MGFGVRGLGFIGLIFALGFRVKCWTRDAGDREAKDAEEENLNPINPLTLRVSRSQEASTHMKTLEGTRSGSPLWKVWTLPTSDSLRNSMPLKWHAMATPDTPDCGWVVLHDLREPGFALRDLRKPWS